MKALIIGAAGFVGKYLLHHLQETYEWSLYATKLPGESIDFPGACIKDLDILDLAAIENILEEVQPDYIFHLAAQSSVSLSWKNPQLTIDINIKGSINILEAVRKMAHPVRLLMIGSGEEYGHILPEETPISEDTLLRPGNIYAATKACQNMVSSIYARAYNMDVLMVRAFNHIGPGQAPIFVVSDFCKQVAEIEAGIKEPVIHVGNLSARRDFTDVRDVVRAYGLIMLYGNSGETYNVGSGQGISIEDLLNRILKNSSVNITVETEKTRLRPVDVPVIEANISKLQAVTGWKPEISVDTTILETLNYWRSVIHS